MNGSGPAQQGGAAASSSAQVEFGPPGAVVYWSLRHDAPGRFGPRGTRAALLSEMWASLGLPGEPHVTRGPSGAPELRESPWGVSFAGIRLPAGSGPDVSLVALCQGACGIDAEHALQPGPGRPLATFVLQEALLKALGTGFLLDVTALREVPSLAPGVLGSGVAWFQTVPLGWFLSGVSVGRTPCLVAWAVRDAASFEVVRLG